MSIGLSRHGKGKMTCSSHQGDSIDMAKMITKKIVKAEDWKEIRTSLETFESSVNIRHLTTALYFLVKKNVRVFVFKSLHDV